MGRCARLVLIATLAGVAGCSTSESALGATPSAGSGPELGGGIGGGGGGAAAGAGSGGAALGGSGAVGSGGGTGGATNGGSGLGGASGSRGEGGAGDAGEAGESGTGGSSGSAGTPTGTPVAVAVGYGRRRAHSFDGVDWTLQELTADGGDDNDLLRGVTFGDGRFVAVGGSSMALTMISVDGVEWSEAGSGRAWLGGAAWNGDVFVAAGGNGLRVRSMDGAMSWTDDAGYQAVHYRSVTSGGGLVVAVGHTYNGMPDVGVIATTSDGVVWDERRHDGARFGTVAYGNGVFVASGDDGLVATSSDGFIWNDQTVGTGSGTVIFAAGAFVVSKASGFFRSDDGIAWTPVAGVQRDLVGRFEDLFVAFDWPLRIWTSRDLMSWDAPFQPMGSGLTQLVVGYVP